MAHSYVKVSGTQFTKDGSLLLFHGLGVGTWLNLEHFMIGIPTLDHQIRNAFTKVYGADFSDQFWDSFARSFVTEKDFEFLKSCGVNVIRVPFNYHLFLDDQQPDVFCEQGFVYFDRLLDLCDAYQIYLLPDLHTTPGGQNPDWHSDNATGIPQFWHYKVFRDQMITLWKKIAEHCRDREYLLGYDLLNEPYLMDAPDLLTDFYEDVTKAIRSVDPNHILFLEGDLYAMKFDCIHQITDENTALTFHYYPTVWEPELFSDTYSPEKRREKFREILDQLISIRETFGRPIICGETGYDIDKNNVSHAMQLLDETLSLFHEKEVSWIIWCYKDAQFMGLCYPKPGSPWMQFTDQIHQKWNHYKEREEADELMNDIRKYPEFSSASDDLCYAMQFRQRGILYRFQAECILIPLLEQYTPAHMMELPQSFLFENCDYYKEYADLLRRWTK